VIPVNAVLGIIWNNAGHLRGVKRVKMVLADLGRKINSALRSLSNAVVINEEVSVLLLAVRLLVQKVTEQSIKSLCFVITLWVS